MDPAAAPVNISALEAEPVGEPIEPAAVPEIASGVYVPVADPLGESMLPAAVPLNVSAPAALPVGDPMEPEAVPDIASGV